MDNRFSELLTKAQTGRLTALETEELARLMNAPVTEGLQNSHAEFVSSHSFTESDIVRRLNAINWFSRCGEPLSLEISMPVVQVSTWREAMAYCMDGNWENVELEAQNQLTLWLHHHDRQNYQEWNELVDGFKLAIVNALTSKCFEPFRTHHGLDIALVHSAQWDVLGALLENAYLGSGHRCFFSLELLLVYEAGHFPCGWIGEWPDGELVVY